MAVRDAMQDKVDKRADHAALQLTKSELFIGKPSSARSRPADSTLQRFSPMPRDDKAQTALHRTQNEQINSDFINNTNHF
eukprot:3447140-Amphidinium_carterae.1